MINRRAFIRRTARVGAFRLAGIAGLATDTGSGRRLSHSSHFAKPVPVPLNLPPAFAGKTVAVLADLHHGPFVSIDFALRFAVHFLTNSLAPDLIALVGDYAHGGGEAHLQLPPCLEALSALSAPLGVFAVPGNHDMQRGGAVYRELIAATSLTDLTNSNRRVALGGDHLWVAGVDDLWWGKPDLNRALDGVPAGTAVILLSHNPDFAEDRPDGRVGLVLSGHTHGGQVYLRGLGSRLVALGEVRSEIPARVGAGSGIECVRVAGRGRGGRPAADQRPAGGLLAHSHSDLKFTCSELDSERDRWWLQAHKTVFQGQIKRNKPLGVTAFLLVCLFPACRSDKPDNAGPPTIPSQPLSDHYQVPGGTQSPQTMSSDLQAYIMNGSGAGKVVLVTDHGITRLEVEYPDGTKSIVAQPPNSSELESRSPK